MTQPTTEVVKKRRPSPGRGAKPGERRGGRKAGTPNKATTEIKALARLHAEAAMIELARLATAADSEGARVAAIKELFDRGFGRSAQIISNAEGEDFRHEFSWRG